MTSPAIDIQMEQPPTDKRVIRTRAAIDEAFGRLLDKMPYSKITVSAIAREADINRKTFYLHYASVDELLKTSMRKAVLNAVNTVARSLDDAEDGFDLKLLTNLLLHELADSPHLNSNIAKCVPLGTLMDMMMEPLHDLIVSIRRQRNHTSEPPQLDVALACYLGSVMFSYREWLQEDEPRGSLEQISDLICDLFANRAKELL